MKPHKIGKCLVKSQIGRGAMGTVYLAHHETLRIPVAVKTVPAEAAAQKPEFARRLMEEAHLAASLNHPNIIRVYDCGEEAGLYYVVMEFVQGQTCAERIERDGPIPWQEAVQIAGMVADALRHAAAQGIMHRDVKPANIILVASGVPKLADLGLATKLVKAGDEQGLPSVGGTPMYMSPEHFVRPDSLDFRSDMYSLGATLYHMVCGQVPFPAATYKRIRELHLREPLPSPRGSMPELPESLCDVISKMMAKDPQDRYQSYEELIADLRRVEQGQEVSGAGSELRLQAGFIPEGESVEEFLETSALNFGDVPLSFDGAMAKVCALVSLLAASAGILILSHLGRTTLGFAAGWGVLVVLVGGWVLATRLWLRSGVHVTGGGSESKREMRALQILEVLQRRTPLRLPRLCVHHKGERDPLTAGLRPSTASIHLFRKSFEDIAPSDLEMEALLAGEVGRVYNGDSAFMTLLLAPILLYRKCRAPFRKLYRVASGISGARWPAVAISLAGLLGAAALLTALFLVGFWPGMAGSIALFLPCALHAFQRHSQHAADLVAAQILSRKQPVMSLAAKAGLANALERPVILKELGVKEQGEQGQPQEQHLQLRRHSARAVRHFEKNPVAPGLMGILVELLIDRPLAARRIRRLVTDTGERRLARWIQAGPVEIYLRMVGRREPAGGSSRPFAERMYPHVPAAALAGALTAALTLGFLYAGYAYAWLAPVMTAILSFIIGVPWALRCIRQGYLAGERIFALLLIAYALAFASMVIFAFFGWPRYVRPAFSFPSIFLLSFVFALLGDITASRLSGLIRRGKPLPDDGRQHPKSGSPRESK